MKITSKASSSLFVKIKELSSTIEGNAKFLLAIQWAAKISKYLASINVDVIDIKSNAEPAYIYPACSDPFIVLERTGISEESVGLLAFIESVRVVKDTNSISEQEFQILNKLHQELIVVLKNKTVFEPLHIFLKENDIECNVS